MLPPADNWRGRKDIMPRMAKRLTFTIIAVCLVMTGVVAAQGLNIGQMEFDRNEWGSRKVFIPAENNRDDTARLDIAIQTIYPGHYLSGLDRLNVDTSVIVGPGDVEDFAIPFKMHGSFERVVTRVMIHWRYDKYPPEPGIPDSTFQMFNNVFRAHGEAAGPAGKKYSIGPVYSVMDHFQLNFEYPRLVLYFLSRGETPEKISTLFEADVEYTNEVIEDFRKEGFFPLPDDKLAPGIIGIAEYEGYVLKTALDNASDAFSAWYDESGRKEFAKILGEAGIDSYTAQLPAVQMPLLISLLMNSWVDPGSNYDVMRFQNAEQDLKSSNLTRWIVQGGDYFLPKLCLGVFEEQGDICFGAFSPDPKLPFDKATIFNLRGAVEKDFGSLTVIEAAQLRLALSEAAKAQFIDNIAGKMKSIVTDKQTLDIFEDYRPYKAPYLADYICRIAMGRYFIDHAPKSGLDCIRVRY